MTKLKLYQKLFKWAKKKTREAHMDKYHNDIKCPRCNEWFSITGIDHEHEHLSEPDFGFHVKCGQCGHESYWNAVVAPVLLLCDKNGTPIQ